MKERFFFDESRPFLFTPPLAHIVFEMIVFLPESVVPLFETEKTFNRDTFRLHRSRDRLRHAPCS